MKTGALRRIAGVVALTTSAAACGAVAAGAAGAGAAIAYSERGVSSVVEGDVDEVFNRSRAVFAEMNITETAQDSNDQGTERELQGRSGNKEVTVDIERERDGLSSVAVYAQESTIEWDRDYARDVLARIIAQN